MTTASPSAPSESDACLNCRHPFKSERLAYCPACGQDTRLKPPTLGEFAQQFGGSYIAAEGALWRSLKLLLLQPGELTREYLVGRRRRYVLPLRMYLTVSLIALLLLRWTSAYQLEVKAGDAELSSKPVANAVLSLGFAEAGIREGRFFCDGFPNWLCARLEQRIHAEPRQLLADVRRAGDRLMSNIGSGMFILLPTFAFWLWLFHRNRGLRYTEHLVFALHVHAFWFAMLTFTLFDLGWLDDALAVAVPVYTLLAMRRVYGGRWVPRLLRAAVISLLYGATLGLTLGLLSLWAFLG